MRVVWVGGTAVRTLVTDVLSTQSTSDPDVVNGISESIGQELDGMLSRKSV